MKNEYETSYHLQLLIMLSVLGVLLVVVNVISGWEDIAVPGAVIMIAMAWSIHFLELGKSEFRLYTYVIFSLILLIYYGYHRQTITDIPIVLCLLIIMLSGQRDIRLVNLVALSYLIMLFENIFITRFLITDMDQLLICRVALGIVCLFCAVMSAHFFFRRTMETEIAMQEMKKEIESISGESTKFLSNVSHELRTPINAVNGMSEILLHKNLSPEVISDVGVIREAGKRLYRQVSDMIDFSEIQTGHYVIQNENYEPVSAVNDAVFTVFGGEGKKTMDFAIDVETTLPKVLNGDMMKIKKILVCLLDNAVKFTNQGGGYLYVSKREEEYGINLNIDLWDTGVGMSRKEVDKLYQCQMFKTDHEAEKKIRGMGLGFYIVQGIVNGMNGFLTIQSKKGVGTHIHVSIPQQVKNIEPSITLDHSSEYRIVSYFNTDKYARKEVGEYYYTLIDHLRTGLKLEIRETFSLEELDETVAQSVFTHLFIGRWEYEVDPEYFLKISKNHHILIFTERKISLPSGSRIKQVLKPVYILSIINALKSTMQEKETAFQTEQVHQRRGETLALIVDDDEMNLIVAGGILNNFGIRSETCTSGEQAIKICTNKNYDIIFMDYMMPELNGTDTMKRIRRIRDGYYKNIPIIALTANAISSARSDFLKEGFDEFLSKPIEIPVMDKILKKMLSWEGQE